MANKAVSIEQVLAQATAPLGGTLAGGLATQIEKLTGQLQGLQSVTQAALESNRTNQQGVVGRSETPANGSGRSTGEALFNALGTGLGLSPLLSGVLKLLGRDGAGARGPSALTKFELPASLSVNAGISERVPGAAFAVDHGQGNSPRAIANAMSGPQITVNVRAMDSRSFLDHSNDIAMAVRQAMLESSVLNDVVREA
jgi:hypothetical protein